MTAAQYLAALKRKLGIESDYAVAKALGVSKQAISNYRRRPESAFDNVMAAKVGELLDIDPMRVIADMELQRAHDAETKSLWKRIAAKVAAGVVGAIGAGLIGAPIADASPSPGATVLGSVYYVKSRRWWLIPLLPPLPDDDLSA